MSTILFNNIIFGPIKSRRLGNSLGINLLPAYGKWCSFDCIYCECGWNKDGKVDKKLPSVQEVKEALEKTLTDFAKNGLKIDTITFSGNGEPTLHPGFAEIIDFTLSLREQYIHSAKVSVLTNGSQINNPLIRDALLKVDNAIIKIDSAFEETVNIIDQPQYTYSIEKIKADLIPFKGKFVLQTMFLTGIIDSIIVNNTTDLEVEAWRRLVEDISPREIMVYTIDRETPAKNLEKVSVKTMEIITAPLLAKGYKVQISG